jgi:hypothetical protein
MQIGNKYSEKFMTVNNSYSQMNFTDLEIGRFYRLVYTMIIRNNNSSSNTESNQMYAVYNGNDVDLVLYRSNSDSATNSETQTLSSEYVFKAVTTAITFRGQSEGPSSANLAVLNGAKTYAYLEELNNYEETEAFT